MSSYCHLGRRRRRPISFKKRLCFLLIPFLLAILMLHLRLTPLLTALAEAEATKRVESLITGSIATTLQEEETLYGDIVSLAYKNDGSVASLQVDTRKLLSVRTRLLTDILQTLQDRESMRIRIPFSSLVGLNLIPSGGGIELELRATRSMNAYFASRFEVSGINQTHHSIYLFVSFDVLLLVPGGQKSVRITRELPIAETIIVGEVPDAYTKINRLTDDISEGEIDDIYDFGAATN